MKLQDGEAPAAEVGGGDSPQVTRVPRLGERSRHQPEDEFMTKTCEPGGHRITSVRKGLMPRQETEATVKRAGKTKGINNVISRSLAVKERRARRGWEPEDRAVQRSSGRRAGGMGVSHERGQDGSATGHPVRGTFYSAHVRRTEFSLAHGGRRRRAEDHTLSHKDGWGLKCMRWPNRELPQLQKAGPCQRANFGREGNTRAAPQLGGLGVAPTGPLHQEALQEHHCCYQDSSSPRNKCAPVLHKGQTWSGRRRRINLLVSEGSWLCPNAKSLTESGADLGPSHGPATGRGPPVCLILTVPTTRLPPQAEKPCVSAGNTGHPNNLSLECLQTGCGEKGTLRHCWWECSLGQPLWKTYWTGCQETRPRSTQSDAALTSTRLSLSLLTLRQGAWLASSFIFQLKRYSSPLELHPKAWLVIASDRVPAAPDSQPPVHIPPNKGDRACLSLLANEYLTQETRVRKARPGRSLSRSSLPQQHRIQHMVVVGQTGGAVKQACL
ncbi:LINE-1 retrotransposable element ORF2 protein [Camelus dromedarius]|uniref:LINE-1 retrotransposable element ORF2 protein n=1 Tax=Camelus dromedarius TaxID=9838 RepID=A0A5N4CAM1_CAMDR|nr:LINE-1 retrotransposable element ORF2 protein [Camelus dromedarius]